ncbi:MAG: helix-hairpin-helix domain-containing protein [Kiritimatiellia bacterium]
METELKLKRDDAQENGDWSRDLLDAVSAVTTIEATLGEEDEKEHRSDVSFQLPLNEAVSLVPDGYRVAGTGDRSLPGAVMVTMDNLFSQLASGRVTMSVAQLAYFIPSHLLSHAAFEDTKTKINLPLPLVVKSVGVEKLKKHTAGRVQDYGMNSVEDPFRESAGSGDRASGAATEKPKPEAPPAAKSSAPPEPQAENGVPPVTTGERAVSGVTFEFPLAKALSLMPEKYVKTAGGKAEEGQSISLTVHDLYSQLALGRISLSVSSLAYFLPSELVADDAFGDEETHVSLPLADVVKSIGVDKLKARTTKRLRHYDTEGISDPFRESEKPEAARQPAEKPEVPEAQKTAAGEETIAAVEYGYRELPGNVNINTAGARELTGVPGLSLPLAEKIVEYRDRNGFYRSIFDLKNIEGLGRKTFKRMTGMPLSRRGLHRRLRLARLLNIPPDRVSDFKVIAEAMAKMPGFSGCVISDPEGLVVSQSGVDQEAESIGAIAPRIAAVARKDMDIVNSAPPDSISIAVSGKMYTVAANEKVTLTAIHEESRVTKTQLAFIRRVWGELDWLLSHRVYAGPPPEDSETDYAESPAAEDNAS